MVSMTISDVETWGGEFYVVAGRRLYHRVL